MLLFTFEGDESHTATEGEWCGDEDEEGEEVKKERERRKQEIKHMAPLTHEDTSDTEVRMSRLVAPFFYVATTFTSLLLEKSDDIRNTNL